MRLWPDVHGVVLRVGEGLPANETIRMTMHGSSKSACNKSARSSAACSSGSPHQRTTSGVRNHSFKRGISDRTTGRNVYSWLTRLDPSCFERRELRVLVLSPH